MCLASSLKCLAINKVKVTEAFRSAEALADFANLDPADSASVVYFRNNYPEFAPGEWWDYLYRINGAKVLRYDDVIRIPKDDPNFRTKIESKVVLQWREAQEQIRQAWSAKFKFKTVSEFSDLLKLVFYVDRPGLVWNSSQVLLPNGTVYDLHSRVYEFHRALLYLQQHPRQAKICANCRKYFVHVHGKREYCLFPDSRGETCSQKRINESHSKWGRENNWGRKKTTR